MKLKALRNLLVVLTVITLSAGGGYWLGKREVTLSWQNFKPQVSVINKEAPAIRDVDFSLFWEVWSRLERNYIERTKIDSQKMIWGAIRGMTAALEDPYTVFLAPSENKKSKEDLNGEFEGIGAQLGMKDKKVIVIAPLKGMPAEKAGLKAGDWIIKVDNEETAGWSVFEAVEKIRGPKGSKVVLQVLHEGEEEPVVVEILRETIKVPSVEIEVSSVKCPPAGEAGQVSSKENCGKVAILKLYRFGEGTNGEWEKAVDDITKLRYSDIKGLILDLRNNPGGYLQGSVFIASEFLEDGLVVTQEYADGRKQEFKVNRKGDLTKIPMVVLINKGSASASEIVAGALKIRGRAKLVGEQSFGKGSIQEAQDLTGGAGLHITTARWLLPDGSWINEKGLTPDIEVVDNPETEVDEQVEKGIEVLLQ